MATKSKLDRIVLMPVGTIGCGKTTLAATLQKLFGWAHVQNDDVNVKSGKARAFAMSCVQELKSHAAVVADRNNHLRRERDQLMVDVAAKVRTRLVCLHYVHDVANVGRIQRITQARVIERGDNHQTIKMSNGVEQVFDIMKGFIDRFEPVNVKQSPDDQFDLVINLDPCASTADNVEVVLRDMCKAYPGLISNVPNKAAIHAAVRGKHIPSGPALTTQPSTLQVGLSAPKVEQLPRGPPSAFAVQQKLQPPAMKVVYFAVHVPSDRVVQLLDDVFRDVEAQVSDMYRMLKKGNRLQRTFHVTLIHRASSGQHADYWNKLMKQQQLTNGPLGQCRVRMERVVWDSEVMAFVVRLEGRFRSVNNVAHITVGTVSDAVKPAQANVMLDKWLREEGGSDIMVDGVVELEGAAKAFTY
ncbi:hypothetical protein K470DRAFT_255951 [Piedraia hortae CBS 480.64]|uniref:tRNA ligase phosphodiesterase domain-containing protein n=1 Tax=Piedraia hortae CBS 480.64 TaxID=1314780 RepID=A0A6A7C4Y9_9PEZI|nr:hypothetical protein K470DRAFT_255951 [Piedraia hortae CBS 480.64]